MKNQEPLTKSQIKRSILDNIFLPIEIHQSAIDRVYLNIIDFNIMKNSCPE